jgi:hypothetical protein
MHDEEASLSKERRAKKRYSKSWEAQPLPLIVFHSYAGPGRFWYDRFSHCGSSALIHCQRGARRLQFCAQVSRHGHHVLASDDRTPDGKAQQGPRTICKLRRPSVCRGAISSFFWREY